MKILTIDCSKPIGDPDREKIIEIPDQPEPQP
jgi:hypothetical protein